MRERSGSRVSQIAFRGVAVVQSAAIVCSVLIAGQVTTAAPVFASTTCATGSGKDGAAGNLSGVYNSYYIPAGSVGAGSTTLTVTGGPDTSSGGAATTVAVNDELLVIQMQDGSFTSSNSASYGNGSGSGGSALTAGAYEYVSVTAVNGNTFSILGAGSNSGLINSYTESAANGISGQKTYQIVRVPQYTTGTLTSNFTAAYWNGKTGGVAVLDMASTLNLGGASIYATGDGFRGGGVTIATSTPTNILNSDWAASSTMNGTGQPGHGSKGEGVMGTPRYLFEYTSFVTPSNPTSPTVLTNGSSDGYPGGDQARGAPGNAGGGGTDQDPASNDQNTGGGGGGNGGAGGNGGYPWTPDYSGNTSMYSILGVHAATGYSTSNTADIGGRGGSAYTSNVGIALMGGGGGAGANNNGSNNNSYNAYGSSGGVGGGIVLLRLNQTSGTPATIYANGTTGLAPANDGGGGGGAGGTVIITSPFSFTGITVHADGAAGTTAEAAGTTAAIQHGPGGGGGGGFVATSSSVTASASGGAAGTTSNGWVANDTYGATAGTSGIITTVSATSVPGVASGAECYSSPSSLLNGPRTVGTFVGYSATGSYDGAIPVSNNNDFTAVGFFPTGATTINSSTTLGSPSGNTISQGPTTIQVASEFDENNTSPSKAATVTLSAIMPGAGWTAQICPDNGLSGSADGPSCSASGSWLTVGAPSSAPTSTYNVPKKTDSGTVKYWVQYSAPAGLTAFTRYDARVTASDGTTSNDTHHEMYLDFMPLTKTATVLTTNCPAGQSVPASGVCPGGTILFAVDYRNIVVGASTEANYTTAWPSAQNFTIREDSTTGSWTTATNGLMDVLVSGANGSSSYGVSTAGAAFTGNTVGSTNVTVNVGTISPAGTGGVSQGTLWFRVTVK